MLYLCFSVPDCHRGTNLRPYRKFENPNVVVSTLRKELGSSVWTGNSVNSLVSLCRASLHNVIYPMYI